MSLTDKSGVPWAHSDTIKKGDKVRADGGFPCIAEGAVLTVKHGRGRHGSGLYVDCTCEETGEPQKHFLDGQAGDDGALTGLYKAVILALCMYGASSLADLAALVT